MHSLAFLYIKTPLGRAWAFNALANLRPPLRILLKAVDGKMVTTELVPRFTQLGNVEHLLLELEASGFIAERSATSAVAPHAEKPDLHASVASKPDTPLDSKLSQVVDWMATFVLTYMPEKSFTELAAIEKIRTPQQLTADLPRYEALVMQVGAVGVQHIDELSQLMVQLFSPHPAT
jgi:hypothetical protein